MSKMRQTTWKAAAARLTRLRRCVPYDLGRAFVCSVPWEPGDSHLDERMGPERRPCPLCEVHRALSEVIERHLRLEIEQERQRRDAQPYRAQLEEHRDVMRQLREVEAGHRSRCGTEVMALLLFREHGSVEAALKELTADAYTADNESYWDSVRLHLRLFDVPAGEVAARYAQLLQGAGKAQDATEHTHGRPQRPSAHAEATQLGERLLGVSLPAQSSQTTCGVDADGRLP